MELIRLKVNSQYRPCVDEAPYFSWVITSDEKNVMQTSYHITVKNMDEVMWDSGMVESDKSIFVEYSGKPLQSLSDYNWTVEVTVNNGEKAAASSSFETGFMKKEWTAEWVKSPFPMKKVKPGTGGQNPAEYFRKEFGVRDGIKRARVYATCHGAYQLSMNGMRPDDREFAPEFTVYSKYLCYQTYDVTPFLREGGNVIGMLVGDGWYDSANFKPRSRKFKAEHSVLFQIKIDYEDGTSEMVLSDDAVKVSESPVRSSDLFAGELYDARMEQENWNCCGFDDSSWKAGIPCITINTDLAASKRIAYVGSDYYKCGQTAAGLLVRLSERVPVFYALGNHEYKMLLNPETEIFYSNYEKLLTSAGICFLHNEHTSVQLKGNDFVFHGLELPVEYYHKPNSPALSLTAMEEMIGTPSQPGFHVLLAHNPKYGNTYFSWGADLILSGHYHGGVLRLDQNHGLTCPQYLLFPPFCCGEFKKGKQHMIVSAGLGEHTIPVRIHNPRELVLINLYPQSTKSVKEH